MRALVPSALVLLTACGSARYVGKVRPPPPAAVAIHAGDLGEADTVLEEARRNAEAGGLLAGMSEVIAVLLDGQLAYTVTLADGRASINKGANPDRLATLVVPVTLTQLLNLRAAVADGRLDEQEIFNLAYVLFVPCLKRIHAMFYFTNPGDKRSFRVDNFMHFAIKNPQGLSYHGQPVVVGATVLNVDGFFFHLPGLTGDPDVRYEFTLPEALSLYSRLVYEAERLRQNPLALLDLGNDVRGRLERAITYTRSWH